MLPVPHRFLRIAFVLVVAVPALASADTPSPGRATSTARAPRRSAEELALLAIQADVVRRVQALVERGAAMPDGPAREALERQAMDVKRQGEIDFLVAKREYALARGDLATARNAEELIARILDPIRAAGGPAAAKPGEKGGER